ncbi:DUF2470 domain-containing protein [Kitasatospora nipponensis]|uniref:DUF2470 domain-containing protein n=1 Tax=Kitasatospora nipponensis TaxID=258049 RepID=A0ABP4HQP0_9ACTN
MTPTDGRKLVPTDAERLLGVLAAASSLTVTAREGRYDLLGTDLLCVRPTGVAWLRVPADGPLADAGAPGADPQGRPVLVEWTDVAPAAVRDRVRARVRIAGRIGRPGTDRAGGHGGNGGSGDGTVRLLFEVSRLSLAVRRAPLPGEGPVASGADLLVDVPVSLDELARAHPDPLARFEGALLTHLADDHQDHLAALTRLLDPYLLAGVVRVSPLALDRYGLTLRLEQARTHQDVRLTFDQPAAGVDDVGHRIHALLATAQPRHRRQWVRDRTG